MTLITSNCGATSHDRNHLGYLKALEIGYQMAGAHGLWLYTLDYLCLCLGFFLLADIAGS